MTFARRCAMQDSPGAPAADRVVRRLMRAVLCHGWGAVDDLTIADVPAPTPAAGEVLIAVRATAVNYADAIMVAGRYQTRPPLPFSPGLETAGIVTALAAEPRDG